MPTKTLTLKAGMKVTVPGEVVGFHEISGRDVVTVEVAQSGQRVTFDQSWLPDAKEGDQVRLPGFIKRPMLPRVSVKLDYFGTPVTVGEDDVRPV